MRRRASISGGLAVLLVVAAIPTAPVHAQFEDPDTVPRFGIGPTGEITIRGTRGESPAGTRDISFGGGPLVGLRAEYRLTRTLSLDVSGGWARLDEKQESGRDRVLADDGFSQIQVAGELLLRVKPSIPGYFILGGGARLINPDEADDPNNDLRFHDRDSFTDVMGVLGVGLELGARRHRVFKLGLRLYFVSPAEQERFETNSLSVDLGIGGTFMFRI